MQSALLFLLAVACQSAVLLVPANFRNISSALLNANRGDTIEVSEGTYTGPENCDLVINKENLKLVAPAGATKTTVDCQLKSRCLRIIGAQSIVVSGFHFRNGQAPATPPELSSPPFVTRRSVPSEQIQVKLFKVIQSKMFREKTEGWKSEAEYG